jgi:hypothetical protein
VGEERKAKAAVVMGVPELKAWIPALVCEPSEPNCIGYTLAKAKAVAEEEAQDHWDSQDPRWCTIVHVRDEEGKLHVFAVEAKRTVTFTAKEVPVSDG